jgi:microcystin-dependent protein
MDKVYFFLSQLPLSPYRFLLPSPGKQLHHSTHPSVSKEASMKRLFIIIVFMIIGLKVNVSAQEAFIGEIRMVAFNYAPMGWLFCDGSILQISQYQALFALIGNQFGGNGSTTFALPDLRSRFPLGAGAGSGLTTRSLATKGGEENHILTTTEMPMHTHSLFVNTAIGTSDSPSGNFLARNSEGVKQFSTAQNGGSFSPQAVGGNGGGGAHNTMPPYATVNYIICVSGIFPQRP